MNVLSQNPRRLRACDGAQASPLSRARPLPHASLPGPRGLQRPHVNQREQRPALRPGRACSGFNTESVHRVLTLLETEKASHTRAGKSPIGGAGRCREVLGGAGRCWGRSGAGSQGATSVAFPHVPLHGPPLQRRKVGWVCPPPPRSEGTATGRPLEGGRAWAWLVPRPALASSNKQPGSAGSCRAGAVQ